MPKAELKATQESGLLRGGRDGGVPGHPCFFVNPAPPDSTAPVTTMTATKSTAKGVTYYAVTLSANEPGSTAFRVTGQGTVTAGGANTTAWQTYTGQITIQLDKRGTATIEYYSVDGAGNQEATKSGVLQ